VLGGLDLQALNDLAMVRAVTGREQEAVALLRACAVLEPGLALTRDNLEALGLG
jgi:hypothetical protein